MLTDKQVQEIRSRFSIFQRKIYLNSCSQGALSDAVQAGLEDYIASWHEQGSPWELWVDKYEAARTAFAKFINASADEVAIVTSASAGINSIASALSFRERKKVVMGEFEFPTMGHVWLGTTRSRRRGAICKRGRQPHPGCQLRKDDRPQHAHRAAHACVFQKWLSFRGKRHHADRPPRRRSGHARRLPGLRDPPG